MPHRAARIDTDRLVLRRWQPQDRAPFATLNGDTQVMAFFVNPLSRAESDALIDRIEAGFDAHGFGFWALEHRETGAFLGMCGLAVPRFDAPFTPCVEIGWRLSRAHWGQGYAIEAARAALACGFGRFGLRQIVAFTVLANRRSWGLMERLGMTRDPADDFDHPAVPPGHPLQRHVLYRLNRPTPDGA